MEGEQGRERGVWPISMLDKALTEWRENRGERDGGGSFRCLIKFQFHPKDCPDKALVRNANVSAHFRLV